MRRWAARVENGALNRRSRRHRRQIADDNSAEAKTARRRRPLASQTTRPTPPGTAPSSVTSVSVPSSVTAGEFRHRTTNAALGHISDLTENWFVGGLRYRRRL